MASGNAFEKSSLAAPTVITPASSTLIATVATRRAAASPLASDTVATMYTTAANADSRYASGASRNLVAIWTTERAVAARANRP